MDSGHRSDSNGDDDCQMICTPISSTDDVVLPSDDDDVFTDASPAPQLSRVITVNLITPETLVLSVSASSDEENDCDIVMSYSDATPVAKRTSPDVIELNDDKADTEPATPYSSALHRRPSDAEVLSDIMTDDEDVLDVDARMLFASKQTQSAKTPPHSRQSSVIELDDDDDDDDDDIIEPNSSSDSNDVTVLDNKSNGIQRLLIYPPTGVGGISINTEDYMCLAKEEYLNDVIIDFYLKYLYDEVLSDAQRERTHIFSTFFYERLVQKNTTEAPTKRRRIFHGSDPDDLTAAERDQHERVKKWTKHVNLFEKDYVFVPINEHNHWYLAVICFPCLEACVAMYGGCLARKLPSLVPVKRPCILILDSMSAESHKSAVTNLQKYLTCEYRSKVSNYNPLRTFDNKTFPGYAVPVPQQDNYSDCGLFVLQFVEEFFINPIRDFQPPIKRLANWFDVMVVLRKREDIALLIGRLVREHFPNNAALLPEIQFPTLNGNLR